MARVVRFRWKWTERSETPGFITPVAIMRVGALLNSNPCLRAKSGRKIEADISPQGRDFRIGPKRDLLDINTIKGNAS